MGSISYEVQHVRMGDKGALRVHDTIHVEFFLHSLQYFNKRHLRTTPTMMKINEL